jgi:ATP-dependent DNA ligase
MPKALSNRQYVHVNNGPAQRLARKTAGVKVSPMPDYIEPLLATEGAPPRGAGWVHEIKYDGYRFQLQFSPRGGLVLAAVRGGVDRYADYSDGDDEDGEVE